MRIREYSHGFECTFDSVNEINTAKRFTDKFLTQYEFVKDPRTGTSTREAKEEFTCWGPNNLTLGLTSLLQEKFIRFMLAAEHNLMAHTVEPLYMPAKFRCKVDPKFLPRGQQPEAVDYILEDEKIRTAHAATGFGKTLSSFFVMEQMGVRTAGVMSATHMATWVSGAKEYMHMTPNNLMLIQGSAALKAAIQMSQMNMLEVDLILFSAETIRGFLKAWEERDVEPFDYGCSPYELWKVLKVGFVIGDEAHEQIHNRFRMTAYTHAPKVLYLSATLICDDPFINLMYRHIFGAEEDIWESDNNKHIAVRPLFYQLDKDLLYNRKFKHNGPRGYSHIEFEKSVMRNKKLTNQYFRFIKATIDSALYDKNFVEGMKGFVMFASIKMGEAFQKYLKEQYPNRTIGLFVGGSAKAELYERDIVIGTPRSIGTGKDVPGLKALIQTVAVNSSQLNLQIMGRLRPVKINGVLIAVDPLYVYLNCEQIKQHKIYHQHRLAHVAEKCKDIKVIRHHFKLGSELY